MTRRFGPASGPLHPAYVAQNLARIRRIREALARIRPRACRLRVVAHFSSRGSRASRRARKLARVLRGQGRTVPPFELPASKSDQALLTAARQFARDAASLEEEFSGHAMGSAVLAAAARAFETAVQESATSRSDHIGARARIRELLSSAAGRAQARFDRGQPAPAQSAA